MNILLGVSGSVAAYKSYDLARAFIKNGDQVRVILTQGALEFVNEKMYHYLGVEKTYLPLDDYTNLNSSVLHIELSHWADKFVLAPMSANTLNKLAKGYTDDLLSTFYLAYQKSSFLFPAMNPQMLNDQTTQQSLKIVSKKSTLFNTKEGLLACGDQGAGKLLDPEYIFTLVTYSNHHPQAKNILISTGASKAPIDPVRFVTNASTGKLGEELAKVFLLHGHRVTLIHGYSFNPEHLRGISNLKLVSATTTNDFYHATSEHFDQCDYFFSTAALSDLEFEEVNSKMKKEKLQQALKVTQAVDILAKMIERKKKQIIIGFAAETDLSQSILAEKLNRKPVNLLVGNLVHQGHNARLQGFGETLNQYHLIKGTKKRVTDSITKAQLAQTLYKEFFS